MRRRPAAEGSAKMKESFRALYRSTKQVSASYSLSGYVRGPHGSYSSPEQSPRPTLHAVTALAEFCFTFLTIDLAYLVSPLAGGLY